MKQYVEQKLRESYHPHPPLDLWVLDNIFRMPKHVTHRIRESEGEKRTIALCYLLQGHLGLLGGDPSAKYLNPWNSARSDLTAELLSVPPAPEDFGHIHMENLHLCLKLAPHTLLTSAEWLATYVYGFTEDEIKYLCPGYGFDLASINELHPLMMSIYRRLQETQTIMPPFQSDLLIHRYHRTKYRMLRYYLDAVYHWIN